LGKCAIILTHVQRLLQLLAVLLCYLHHNVSQQSSYTDSSILSHLTGHSLFADEARLAGCCLCAGGPRLDAVKDVTRLSERAVILTHVQRPL
jgi:hypothetical protein